MTAVPTSALPEPVAALAAEPGAELRETHASWVVLAGDRAYKIKKPVRFAFLDQSTLAARRRLCGEELDLNRELAPDVYLAVRALVPDGAGFRLADADAPQAVEYAIEMRRFDERETLAALLRGGGRPAERARDEPATAPDQAPADEHLHAVARRLVAFHRAAPPARCVPTEPAAAAASTQALIDRNAEELLALLPDAGRRREVADQLRCMTAFVAARAPRLAARAAAGRVRELHGDLRAEHVLPGPPTRIVDRLEFSRALREIDVADELAFLAMDLTALGAPAAARTLVAAYRQAGGDPGDDALVAFHAIYRAQVRAKVALLRARQDARGADPALAEADRLLAVAERFAWQVRLPRVLVVCGPSASGKSVLARELARRCGRQVLSSDLVRKRLAGVAATQRAAAEHYGDAMSARTYRRLGDEAVAIAGGAIVDATFRRRADRDVFADALGDAAVTGMFVECRVPAAVARERAVRRMADPARVSDATPELALVQHAAFEALDEISAARHLAVRTDRPIGEVLAVIAAALDAAVADPDTAAAC